MLKSISFIFTLLIASVCFAQDKDVRYDSLVKQYNQLVSEKKFTEAKEVAIGVKNYLSVNHPSDPRIGIVYKTIGYTFKELKQYDSASYYYNISLNILLDYFKGENYNTAVTRSFIGGVNYEMKYLDKAKKECLKADKVFFTMDFPKDHFVVENCHLLYKIYRDDNDQNLSSQFLKKAIETAEEISGDTYKDLGLYYCDLGEIYLDIENFTKAEENFKTSLELAKKTNSESIIIANYFYLGEVYRKTANLPLAEYYYRLGVDYNKIISLAMDEKEVNNLKLYFSLGRIFFKTGKSDSSFFYLKEAEKIANKYIATPGQCGVKEFYIEYGKILALNKNEQDKALALFQISLSLLPEKSTQSDELKAEIYSEILELYKAKGQKDSVMFYSEKIKKILNVKNLEFYTASVTLSKKGDSTVYKDNYIDAIKYFQMALKNEAKIFYSNDARAGDLHYKLGKSYAGIYDYKKAIEHTWKAFHIYEGLTKNRNSECIIALSKLLTYYQETDQPKDFEKVNTLLHSFED